MTGDAPARSRRGIAGVLSANAAAWSATRLLSVALPWFVLSSTGSATRTGLVVFAQMGPYVVAQLLSGPLIDRVGPKRISVTCDLVAMTAMATAPLLYLTGSLHLWTLMSLMALVGVADGPANAAKAVFVPSATRAARMSLERGTGLTGAVERTAGTVGPALAGVVVATLGGPYALWVTAVLFGLGALIVSATLTDPVVDRSGQPAGSYLARFREGARFVRQDGLLRAIVAMVATTNLLDQAFMAVLLPVWAKSAGHGAEVVGLTMSVFSAASIVASLTAAAIAERLPRRTVYLTGYIIGGLPRFAVMALGLPLWAVLAVFAVSGLGSGFINPILGAVQYERIPAGLLGRVKTLSTALAWSGIPFGGLLGGALVALTGLTGGLWLTGAAYLVAIVLPGLSPEWSRMGGHGSAPDRGGSLVPDDPPRLDRATAP